MKDWRKAENARIAMVRALGEVPPECGSDIPHAPARGPVRVFEGVMLYPDGKDGWRAAPSGHAGRKGMARADAFDVMEAQARRGLFTPSQKAVGRYYAALFEAHACAGMQCASLETAVDRTGGGGGEYIDAVLRDRERLNVLRQRIGSGVSLAVRKVRPSVSGSRALISDRRVVDMVCIEGRTLSDVLRSHGWAVTGKSRGLLRDAFCAALDRMCGPQGGGGIRAYRV